MSNQQREDDLRDFLDRLDRAGSRDLEGIKEEMRNRGEDPETVRARGMAFVKQLKGQLRLASARDERNQVVDRLQSLRNDVRRQIQQTGKNFAQAIRELSGQPGSELGLSFRKLEEMEEDDALEILTEAQLLQLLDELDED
jgi:uncharacterized coiled-coil DUF342 family protein